MNLWEGPITDRLCSQINSVRHCYAILNDGHFLMSSPYGKITQYDHSYICTDVGLSFERFFKTLLPRREVVVTLSCQASMGADTYA